MAVGRSRRSICLLLYATPLQIFLPMGRAKKNERNDQKDTAGTNLSELDSFSSSTPANNEREEGLPRLALGTLPNAYRGERGRKQLHETNLA
ncbi:hypothetical protein BHM03_00024043 [Ensete ventricosum]|nr:hypothetical protein BHM03_00024043 [Ensete ventricosum]